MERSVWKKHVMKRLSKALNIGSFTRIFSKLKYTDIITDPRQNLLFSLCVISSNVDSQLRSSENRGWSFLLAGKLPGVNVVRAKIAHSIIKNNAVNPSIQAALLKNNAPSLLINAI